MKRTFRKALACLLAVLMVLTAAPLSALAFEPVDGKNVGWWGDSNFDATKNETLYNLVNENGSPIEPAYTTAATEFEFAWADAYEVGDLELDGDPEELLLDQMKPVITVTVCEMGHSAAGDYPSASAKPTAAAAKTYYGQGTYVTLDSLPTAEDAFGRVINPAELKTGQRIAVTFELGGIDANYATQLKGIADPEYLAFGAYSATRNWATYTTGTSANPFVGNFYSYYGDAASNGGSMICDCATGQFYTPFASNTSVPTSAYTGPEVREKGEHGMFVCAIEFEVLKDCDLSEVLHLDRDKDNNPAWGTTQVIPYDADGSSALNKYFTFDPNDTLHTAGLIALNYTAYDAGSGPEPTTQYTVTFKDYAGNTVSSVAYDEGTAAADVTVPANTASDAQYTYAWPTVATVTGDATYNETATINEYTVTFINAAGVTVAEDTYEYGATPVAPANTANTKRTTYAWPEIANVTADATYNEVVTDLGYKVTVNGDDLAASVTVNGAEVGDGTTINVPLNSTVTLVATPVDGATFVGWKSGSMTVSTDATYTTTVVADVEYTPVFELDTDAQFTVVFVDKFGNVVDTQTVTSGDQIVVPAAPAISGYVAGTDNGWSLTNDEIAALTAAATVKAVYEAAPVTTGYTVTANGATITYKGEETADTLSGLPYDAQVTLYNADATSWVVNDVTVAYGDSYTFFVGADVNVTYTTAAVAQAPSIVGVSVGKVGSDGAYQGTFLASFNLADGKFVKAGYIYGKGVTDASTLDDVDGTNVKAMYFKATPTQFQLNYGYRAQTGTITAIAFLVYKDAVGQNQVIYAAPQVFDYANMPA